MLVDDKADNWISFIDPVGVVRYLHLANDNPVFGVGLISFCKLSRPGLHPVSYFSNGGLGQDNIVLTVLLRLHAGLAVEYRRTRNAGDQSKPPPPSSYFQLPPTSYFHHPRSPSTNPFILIRSDLLFEPLVQSPPKSSTRRIPPSDLFFGSPDGLAGFEQLDPFSTLFVGLSVYFDGGTIGEGCRVGGDEGAC